MDNEILEAVVFAILMENNNGIVGKSPGYIKEKLEAVKCKDPACHLDLENLRKLEAWKKSWHIK